MYHSHPSSKTTWTYAKLSGAEILVTLVYLDEQFLYSMERLSTDRHLALLAKVNNA
jgi:hypothetical protein